MKGLMTMPTKGSEHPHIGIMVDGEFRPLQPLTEAQALSSASDTDDFGLHSSSMTGKATIILSKKQIRRLTAVLTPREFTNNWRRMHGLPMRRRTRR